MKKGFAAAVCMVGLMGMCMTANAQDALKIGYSQANGGDAFRSAWLENLSEKAEERGYTLISTDASDDTSKQISDVESLIVQQCDVILVNGLDAEGIVPALEAINAAGIKCVMIDTLVADENLYDCSLTTSGKDLGKMQGEYIKQWIEEKGVELKDRKSTRLNSSHPTTSRMPSSA